jgi:general nucleoside transport system ATP-binding protein
MNKAPSPDGLALSGQSRTPILELDRVNKSFGSIRALKDVSLSVAAGEIHCLLGENGAGKSTLCNIVFGFLNLDSGEMRLAGRAFRPSDPADCLAAGISMVHQHFSVISSMTVIDNLMLGQVRGRLRRAEYADKIHELSSEYRLKIDPYKRIRDMSVGERQRVEFLKCLLRRPRLLVLDEPTAVLPPTEIDAVFGVCRQMASQGAGIILVTHKLAEVADVADRTTVLRGGRVVETSAMRGTDTASLIRAMIGRDLDSLDKALAGSLGVETESGQPDAATKHQPIGSVLHVEELSYYDSSGVARLQDVDFAVAPGEIVGLAGVEGNGQGELADILAGMLAPTAGRVLIAGRDMTGRPPREVAAAGAGIVPEDRHVSGCILRMSVAENLFLNEFRRFSRFGVLRRSAMHEAAKTIMHERDIRASGPTAPMWSLSGGNQQKAVLARELGRKPLLLLVAAQPTRGLDVGAVEAVYRRIRDARNAGAGVLLISSELSELLAVANRVLVVYRGRIVGGFPARPEHQEAIGALMSGQTQVATAA